MGDFNELCFEKIKIIKEIPWKKIITGNTNYLIYEGEGQFVNIYNCENKKNMKIQSYSSVISMHPKYENIFILAEGNIAKIFEIIRDKFECIEKSKVKGHTGEIKLVVFSNYNDKIFATYSNDNTIKVWKLDEVFCLCNILLMNKIYNFKIFDNFIFFYNYKKSNITRYNYIKYEEFEYEYIKEDDFIILNEKEIAGIKNNNILIKYSENQKKEELILKAGPLQMFYDKKLDYLYLFFNFLINVINMKKMQIIFEKSISCFQIFYMNNQLNKDIYANFLLLNGNIEYYSLIPNQNKKLNYNYNVPFTGKEFWTDTVKNIAGIENLEWKANIDEELSYKKKKYLDSMIINQQINLNYEKKLEIKKIEVSQIFDPKKEYEYIQLLEMVIKDNTNEELVIQYLKHLKNKAINFPEKESFQNEYEHYKKLFDNEKLKSNQFDEKGLLEKDNFISLLNEIKDLDIKNKDKIEKIKTKVKNELENIQLFYQPIDLTNKELYWYRNILVIYFALDKIFNSKEKIQIKLLYLMIENIKIIINRDIFNKDYILNNVELLTSILIIIIFPQVKNLTEFNLNIIESADPKYNYLEELNKNKMKSFRLNSKDIRYYYETDGKIKILENPSSACISNFILNINNGMQLDTIELNNYNNMIKEFNNIFDFEKLSEFLSIVISSRVFKEAFKILYPEYYKFPFENKSDTLKFLKQYFHFVPLKNYTAAITERFSLEIFFILKIRKVYIPENLGDENNNLIKKILYRGSAIPISSHEINHEFYNIFLMHSNGTIPLETPRKHNIHEHEGGNNMEILLFNQPMHKISLLECMYLLNEKNYNKSLNDFKEGFNECKNEDLKGGIFEEFNKILEIENFVELAKTSNIRCNDDNDSDSNILNNIFIDNLENSNDVLGFIREPSKLYQ